MENTIVTIFVILALLVGAVGGYVISPTETITEYQDKIVEVPVNVSVETLVEVPAPDLLSLAVDAFMNAVEDEEDEAGNDVNVLGRYNFDEIEVSRVYDDYIVTYDDDTTTVNFEIKLRFDMDDKAAIKKTYNVEVIFEDSEDTIVKEIKED